MGRVKEAMLQEQEAQQLLDQEQCEDLREQAWVDAMEELYNLVEIRMEGKIQLAIRQQETLGIRQKEPGVLVVCTDYGMYEIKAEMKELLKLLKKLFDVDVKQ